MVGKFFSHIYPVAYKGHLYLTYSIPRAMNRRNRRRLDDGGSFWYSYRSGHYYYAPASGDKHVRVTAEQAAEAICQFLLQRDKIAYAPAPRGPLPIQSIRADGLMPWPLCVRERPWGWTVGIRLDDEPPTFSFEALAKRTLNHLASIGRTPQDWIEAFPETCGTRNSNPTLHALEHGLIMTYDLPSLVRDAERSGIPGLTIHRVWTVVYGSYPDEQQTHPLDGIPPYQITTSGNAFVLPCVGLPGRMQYMMREHNTVETLRVKNGSVVLAGRA